MRRNRIPALILALVMTVAMSSQPGHALAVDASSDIPGIPLPGAVVSGLLGGPIYDVVYRFEAPASSVIIAGMTGSAGTDFDLYLFDSTATTVINNVGVMAKSIGPTSEEALAYVTRAGGTFYLDLNGATNVEGTFTLSVQVVPDPSPPILSVAIDGGAVATNDPTVTVTLEASDDLSGVSDMAFSADGIDYGPWQAYSPTSKWTFPNGDGDKSLWVKVRNGVGGESAPAVGSIKLDTQAPIVTAVSPDPNSVALLLRPTIRITFNEQLDPASWTAPGFVLQTGSGAFVSGRLVYDTATKTGTFTPDADLVAGDLYFATLGQPRDLAGNVAATTASWWIRPMNAASISLQASARAVTFGTPVVLSGIASIPPTSSPTLEARPSGAGDYAPVATSLPSGGFYSTLIAPSIATTYRVSFPGSATWAAATSPGVTVGVRWWVVLSGRGPAITRTGKAGKAIAVEARVAPVSAGVGVSFKLYRYDPARGAYIYAGSRGTRVRGDGTARISWTPSAGRWRWRVSASAAPGFSAATSAAYTWSISRP
jgi:hypothetical protein